MGLFHFSRAIAKDFLHNCRSYNLSKLSDQEQEILREMDEKGFAVVPNFLSADQCRIMRDAIDRLIQSSSTKLWLDDAKSDKRIFGADRISPEIRSFYEDQFINRMIQTHEKSAEYSGFTLAARIDYTPASKGSGQGWHRDRADFKQTKAILYLTDVNSQTGPLQYLEGSHRLASVWMASWKAGLPALETRLSDQDVEKIQKVGNFKLREFTASKGTLLLLNTRGIHRGKPLEPGQHRYALTNYYWFDEEIPTHIKEYVQVPSGQSSA